MALFPDIVTAVNAFLPTEVNATVPGTATPLFGEEQLAIQVEPPRVVWVPTTDSFAPAQQRGDVRGQPRALHTARSAVDVHCWGAGSAEALSLRDAFILALRSALGPNYQLAGGRWIGQHLTALGRVYVLSIAIDIPITEGTPALAPTPNTLPASVNFSPSPGP